MGRRGPAPAPAAVKLAKGERRPSRVNYDEPKIDPPKSTDPPPDLVGAGLAEWNRQIGQLVERGVLTDADMIAFENYCRALTDLRRFEVAASKASISKAIAKGYQSTVIKLRQQCNQLAQQCGLTPSSRTNVTAAKAAKPTAANPLERYLRVIPGGQAKA